jgi:hypothetical protein
MDARWTTMASYSGGLRKGEDPCGTQGSSFVAGAGFEPATYHWSAERSEARRRPHFEAEQDSKKADMSIGL